MPFNLLWAEPLYAEVCRYAGLNLAMDRFEKSLKIVDIFNSLEVGDYDYVVFPRERKSLA